VQWGGADPCGAKAPCVNLGAAAGGAIGGLLLALAGYDALAVGLPIFGVGSALLAWWPGRRARRAS